MESDESVAALKRREAELKRVVGSMGVFDRSLEDARRAAVVERNRPKASVPGGLRRKMLKGKRNG